MLDLGTVGRDLGGDMPNESASVAINRSGQIIGNGSVNENAPVSFAFLWQKRVMTAFSTPASMLNTVARAINEHDLVVGWSGDDLGYGRGTAFQWRNGRMTALGTLRGRTYSWANALNEHGQIVGNSYSVDDQRDGEQVRTRAVLWQGGKITDLGTLPGGRESDAFAINESGQIIGVSYDKQSNGRGFVWQNGRMIDLGNRSLVAINDRGQVIANGEERPFLWQNGHMTALPGIDGREGSAVGINDHGQIVGESSTHAVLWTTIPTR